MAESTYNVFVRVWHSCNEKPNDTNTSVVLCLYTIFAYYYWMKDLDVWEFIEYGCSYQQPHLSRHREEKCILEIGTAMPRGWQHWQCGNLYRMRRVCSNYQLTREWGVTVINRTIVTAYTMWLDGVTPPFTETIVHHVRTKLTRVQVLINGVPFTI